MDRTREGKEAAEECEGAALVLQIGGRATTRLVTAVGGPSVVHAPPKVGGPA